METYVARQPIFNKSKKIFGYELLFRGGMSNFFPDIDGDTATSRVLSSSFLLIGTEKITGGRRAFINFTQDLLVKKIPLMFPREKTVIEILEDVEPEEDVINACQEMADKGYCLALDDFSFRPEYMPLISLAKIVKIDFRLTPPEEISELVKELSHNDVDLLAEKVETHEEFQKALEMGFVYFQGYFFSRPQILKGRDIPTFRITLMQIMAEINREDFQFDELEKFVSRDVGISYKLLRYINSAYFSRMENISSIKQAIVLLGEHELRRFLSLTTMTKLASEKPDELVRASIIRAKFCELMGGRGGLMIKPSALFTLGLFSLIDAIMDDSMENLMEKVPLSEGIKNALVYGRGELNHYLRLAVCYEKGDWEGVAKMAGILGLEEEDLPRYYTDSIYWADSFMVI
ncbi:MAG: HDOD domain-containing protein [Deltaproteobacteria bacterium]|nr:HDOD domain-containing protein [Deltaproteobacteria bacterium]MBW1795731.1 HDOD domain-containing protein [Deltaproteobacteria bacterium]